jgi:uncharacterized protein (DUF736 family)
VSQYTKDENEIGALWEKESAKGVYMTGVINEQRVVLFRAKKSSEKAPDWRVLKSLTREEREAQAVTQAERVEPPSVDDVPF